mmetsp:Transcript_29777/g.53875  ORF Transcript_29777/g.53875 Transcript_29777/m.53875 type:complete len:277 (+) Transcript_29777:262-1092(+)
MFAARGDIRGQAPFRISGLTATYKQKVRNWRSVLEYHVLSNASIDRSGDAVIARHHWSREQLKYMQEHQKRPSTSVSEQVAKQTAFSFDSTAKWSNHNTEKVEYFHTPNVPKNVVEAEAKLLFEEQTIRRDQRQAKLKEQKLQDEKQAFEKLSFEDYQTQQKTLGDTIVSLQQKVHALSSENEELKTSVEQLKKENACFRKANKQRLKRKKQEMKHKQEQSFEMSKWGKPTPDQVRAAAQMAARSSAAAVIPQFPPMTGKIMLRQFQCRHYSKDDA